jgi:hypothetical protein
MLRKTMIVLATAAALTGGLTADALARGGGGGGGHGGGFGGGAHMGGFGCKGHSASKSLSVAAGVSRRVGERRTDTMATASDTMATAAIMIRRLSRPTSSSPIRPLSFRRRPRLMPKSYLTRTRECQAKNPTCCALASYW